MSSNDSSRTVQMKFRVTLSEQKKILTNVKKSGLNQGAYIRKMLLDGPPLALDHSKAIFELACSIDRIGVKVNQLARVAKESQNVTPEMIIEMLEQFDQIAQHLYESYGQEGT